MAARKYIEYLKTTMPHNFNLKGIKVILDCANGASFGIAPQLFDELGIKTVTINNKPNGININHNCGSTHPESLQKEVLKQQADLGLAFDGDADRVIAVDQKGNIVDGDQIMAICALNLIEKKQLFNKKVVTTVMSNLGFDRVIEKAGGEVVRTNVGDRYVLEAMQKENAVLGGEQSGHIIFLKYGTTGDGLLTSLQLLRVIWEEEKSLSDLASMMKKYPQIILNFRVKDKKLFYECDDIKRTIKEIEKELAGEGRIFIRPSGTEPLIRILLEGQQKEKLERISQELKAVIEQENI